MPHWDPQTEAEIQHMAGVITTAFRHADDEDGDEDREEQADMMVLEPPCGFSDLESSLQIAKHRRESYELAIHDSRGRPSLTGSDASSHQHHPSQPPPIPPKPPKLTVIAKFAQYSQSVRDSHDNSFDLSDMDLRVFDERAYSDIQQTVRETCSIGLGPDDRVTSSENMSSASEDPLDVPEINVKKVRQIIRTATMHTGTSSPAISSNNSTLGDSKQSATAKQSVVMRHDLPSPSQLVAEPLDDLVMLVDIPDVPEEFRDTVVEPIVQPAVSTAVSTGHVGVERAEPAEYQAWKAQMRELEQLTGAKSSNEPSPVTPSGSHHRTTGGAHISGGSGSGSGGGGGGSGSGSGGYRGFTRRTPIGSTWLYRATSSDPDWEDSETSASSDTQQTGPSTSRGRGKSSKTTTTAAAATTSTSSTPPKSS